MDFLDPQKQRNRTFLLFSGYVLLAIAIAFGVIILLYQAYGFGLGKNGTIVQNGLLFFSSQPSQANIDINGKLKGKTNTRLFLPSGEYAVSLTRPGYRPWTRSVTLEGGSVRHFDYPLLVPTKLVNSTVEPYSSAPGLSTQSPNQRWFLIQQPGSVTNFDEYDLNSSTFAETTLSLPATLVSKSTTSQSWHVIDWADDNAHVLLQHSYDDKSEYILLDRADPPQSVNLSQTLSGASFTKLTFDNQKYDYYYLYDATTGTLQTASLQNPAPTTLLTHVLAYQTYANNIVLYVTDSDASAGKVVVRELDGTQNYKITTLDANSPYLLDLTQYSGAFYVAVGATTQNEVYIYDDPVGQLRANPKHVPVPSQVLHVQAPNYLSFSNNAQFIVAENGQQFGVYDIENQIGFKYTVAAQLDSPQVHASWMDGDRMVYVSNGKLIMFDYDDANQQTLMPASPDFMATFTPAYKYVLSFAPGNPAAGSTTIPYVLTKTSLFTPADQ